MDIPKTVEELKKVMKELKDEMSQLKKGMDPSIAALRIVSVPAKIKMVEISRLEEDVAKVRQLLSEVRSGIEEVKKEGFIKETGL